MAETWYYVDDTTNAQQGPCTVQELGKLFAASSVTDSTLMWKDGQPDWSALSTLPSLHSQVMAAQAGPPALPAKTLPPLPAKPRTSAGGGGGVYNGGGGAYAAAQASGAVVQSMSGEEILKARASFLRGDADLAKDCELLRLYTPTEIERERREKGGRPAFSCPYRRMR